MLRSAFFKNPIVASASASAVATATASATMLSTTRDIFVFSEQSEALKNNAKHLNFKSNVWIEEDDKWWWSRSTELKTPQEKATEITTPRLIEYYNLECLENPDKLTGYTEFMNTFAATEAATQHHMSWRTKLPFKGKLNDEFQEAAVNHGYHNSKFWITATEIQKQKLRLKRGSRRTGILINSSARVFNAEQFKNPEAISKQPLSGYKRRQYGGVYNDVLAQDIKRNNFSTGLYFTFAQLEFYGLTQDLVDGARPAEVPLSEIRGANIIFSLDQVENGDKLAAELNRFPVTEDTYVISGRPVGNEATAAVMKKVRGEKQYKSCYWVSERDLATRGFSLKQGVTTKDGVEFQFAPKKNADGSPAAEASRAVLMYNADQLKTPEKGFKIAGTKAML